MEYSPCNALDVQIYKVNIFWYRLVWCIDPSKSIGDLLSIYRGPSFEENDEGYPSGEDNQNRGRQNNGKRPRSVSRSQSRGRRNNNNSGWRNNNNGRNNNNNRNAGEIIIIMVVIIIIIIIEMAGEIRDVTIIIIAMTGETIMEIAGETDLETNKTSATTEDK